MAKKGILGDRHFHEQKDHKGQLTLIEKENIGATFDPKSPESIAQAITSFLEDTEAYNKAKANLANCKDKYHWENEEKKLLELYGNLEKN